jgi:P27 family predicted phage terminase small subunit
MLRCSIARATRGNATVPAAKKQAERVQRRNKPKAADSQVVKINTSSMPPAPRMSRTLQDSWKTLWRSELAAHWNHDSDLLAMKRLFSLYDRLAKYEKEAGTEALVRGSTGQLVMNPLLKAADTLRGQILALEDRFGLTPMARLKLGIALGSASQSLEEMNKRLASDDAEADEIDDDDPRITAIDTRTV